MGETGTKTMYRTLREVEALLGLMDWSPVLLGPRVVWRDPEDRYSHLAMFRAFLLPFLLPIPSEHALARVLSEKAPLAAICGFMPDMLPSRAMLWHFRHHQSGLFREIMPRLLVALALAAMDVGIALEFFEIHPVGDDARMDTGFEFQLNRTHTRVRVLSPAAGLAHLGLPGVQVSDLPGEAGSMSAPPGIYSQLLFPFEVVATAPGQSSIAIHIREPGWLASPAYSGDLAWLTPSRRQVPFVAVHAVIARQDGRSSRILAGVAASGAARGCYTLPGGTVDQQESVQDAVAREVFEETGLRVVRSRPVSFFFTHFSDRPWVLNIVASVTQSRGEPRVPMGESQNRQPWAWLPLSDIPSRLPAEMFRPSLLAIEHFERYRRRRLEWAYFEENVTGIELQAGQSAPHETIPLAFWGDIRPRK